MISLLKETFLFNEDAPLIFTRFYFWGFFALVLAIYSLIHRRIALRNLYLFVVSLFFYYKTSGLFVLILLFSTVLDYAVAGSIHRSNVPRKRKLLLALSITVNLSMLAYFKYAYFFTESFNELFATQYEILNYFALWSNSFTGSSYEVSKILLPVGISFFTFQTISYTVDVYRGDVQPVRSIVDFGFYVSFFPQLVAGPIVRASEFIPQIYNEYKLSREELGTAVFWILRGLIKKVFIGDYIAVNFIDRVFEHPASYTGFENLSALVAYSLQIYCDFSGYTDIAIGVALLLGYRLNKNFNSPYKAVSCADFWRRWHMSLSTWLKDYLYIPLGGNKKGRLRTDINLSATMLLGGLWHGAGWNFIIWGGLNGVGLIFYKYWKRISPYEKSTRWVARFWKIASTFTFITFTRIFFRTHSMADVSDWMGQVSGNFRWDLAADIIISYKWVYLMMAFGYFTHWLGSSIKGKIKFAFIKAPYPVQLLIITAVIFMVYQSVSSDMQPFIYFQF